MAKEIKERVPSPAKAAVAMQKPRDQYGRFLSGAELQAYQIQQQQAQFNAERDRVNSILGRNRINPLEPIQQMPTQIPQTNFQAIVNANKPGGATPQTEEDKWDQLLGKRRRIL